MSTVGTLTGSASILSLIQGAIATNGANLIGYIEFDGVKGPSEETEHKNWSSVYDLQFGVTRPVATMTGSQRIERATLSDIAVVKEFDKSSPSLFQKSIEGHVFSKVDIHLVQNVGGKHATVFCKVHLEKVFVSNIASHVVSSQFGLVQMESVSLNYSKIKFEYLHFKADGSQEGWSPANWDVAKGTP